MDHVDYKTSIKLAEQHGLLIIRDRGKDKTEIAPEEAYRLESETDRHQVNVVVHPGDYFDPVNPSRTKLVARKSEVK